MFRVEWTADDGGFVCSHDMPLRDALVLAAVLRWAGARHVDVFGLPA